MPDTKTAPALADLKAALQWLPIETAPRDGNNILVWPFTFANWAGTHHVVTMAWFDDNLKGWSIIGTGMIIHPTHWRPLPEPPAAERAGLLTSNDGDAT
ncbi:DUF551 domain-containing protein [Pseudoroseomonas ludipueritiae]|uniref:DUF551 domain-containing protein n=1 Tax=Pseudoroseomonas ludipueritiae TaxID=198093 RepID=A0ABR7R4U0_9PROT|nr:DUF551 domain-containing protein [Pseudoroseomonas ludipueritiae]MBC9176780.1 DUF551 domain-containing protein [Pseudoroseomonas ludipueritiae]